MIKSLFVVALLSIFIEAQEYELLVFQDSAQCLFDRYTIESTGNQGTSSDPCYSNIGTIAEIQDDYRDENGKFSFRLTYSGNIVLVWSQTSWITDSQIVGADLSQIPTQTANSALYFNGLCRSAGTAGSYIDGTPGDTAWWDAVVTFQYYTTGIPGFNAAVARSNKLEILVPQAECVVDTQMCSDIESNTNNIDAANARIDILRDYLKGARADAAHAFNGDVIGDNKSVFGDLFEFSKTELLLLALNLITIVFGLFICWKGGLFSKNNKRGYAKVSNNMNA